MILNNQKIEIKFFFLNLKKLFKKFNIKKL